MRARLLLAAMLLGATSCSHQRAGAAAQAEPAHATAPANLFVTNHFSQAMEVAALASGIQHRLGVVAPEVQGHFVLPIALLNSGGQIEFVAIPSGQGPMARSGLVMVMPGDVVEFTITAQLFNSTAVVKGR